MDHERCHHRFPVPGARLTGHAFDGLVVNLSKDGLAILTTRELRPGEAYSAWLVTQGDRSWVEGRVVWCSPRASLESEETNAFEVGLSVESIDSERTSGDAESPSQPEFPRSEAPAVEASATQSSRPSRHRAAPRVDVSGMRLCADDFDGEVTNFSSRGLAIRAWRALEPGDSLEARLETRDGAVALKAKVVWCEREDSEAEGAPIAYAIGLALDDVDHRLSPLADDFAPIEQDLEPTPWPIADDGVEQESLAPWMAEVTDGVGRGASRSAGRGALARWGVPIALVAVVALVSALWFARGPGEEELPAETVPAAPRVPAVAASPVVGPAEAQPAAAGEGGGGVVAWEAGSSPSSVETESPAIQVDSAPAEPILGEVLPRPGVNVRGGPGLDYPIVRRTAENERLPFVARQGEWFRLQAVEESWMHQVAVRTVVTSPPVVASQP